MAKKHSTESKQGSKHTIPETGKTSKGCKL